jgi:hypothetical protein
MAQNNRVSIPPDLIPHLKAEAESLLLTDNLTDAVNWVLRKYFRDKAANAASPNASSKAQSLGSYDDLFSN